MNYFNTCLGAYLFPLPQDFKRKCNWTNRMYQGVVFSFFDLDMKMYANA